MATMKYYIAVGKPWDQSPAPATGIVFGWCRTQERAIRRATKLSKGIRTDCSVFVHDGIRTLAKSGINSGPGGKWTRVLTIVQ